MILLTDLEIKFLLFGTNSIFHNEGLSIYGMSSRIFSHKINFVKNDFEKISLTKIEDRLVNSDFDLIQKFSTLKEDAEKTAQKFITSAGRQGVLFSSNLLDHQMNPHIHRQAYAEQSFPCLTIHYNLIGKNKTLFKVFDPINKEIIQQKNLCGRAEIKEWCKDKSFREVDLPQRKNVILFDSWAIPHCVIHSNDFNVFFIFDHVRLLNPKIYKSNFCIISHE